MGRGGVGGNASDIVEGPFDAPDCRDADRADEVCTVGDADGGSDVVVVSEVSEGGSI